MWGEGEMGRGRRKMRVVGERGDSPYRRTRGTQVPHPALDICVPLCHPQPRLTTSREHVREPGMSTAALRVASL